MRCTNVLSVSKWNWIQTHAKSVEALFAKIACHTAKTAHNAEEWKARSNQMQYWKSLLHSASNHASIVERCLSLQITRATTKIVKKLQKKQRKLHNRIQLHKLKKNLLHQPSKDKLLHPLSKDKHLNASKDKHLRASKEMYLSADKYPSVDQQLAPVSLLRNAKLELIDCKGNEQSTHHL